jgi:CheY-like chemotaxis protein
MARETAEATSRAKTELLGILSHELRTPLNGVMGGIQLLEMTNLTDEQDEYLQMAKTSSRIELELVNDLLDIAELEASGMKIEARPFILLDCLRLPVSMRQNAIKGRGLTLSENLSATLDCEVTGDCQRIARITGNLLDNAIKFTRQGSISVSAGLYPAEIGLLLRLTITDTGIGIAEKDHDRIFDPFVQVDMSSTRRFGGIGLGLSICRRLAERMGGSIRVESLPGEGSCFTLELPINRSDEQPVDSPVIESLSQLKWDGPPLTVLIAEDNEMNLNVAVGLVQKLGLGTVSAGDGKQALACWLQGNIDAILMDIQMPVMDGLEATAFIRQREQGGESHTPIIALTAHAMAGDRERLLAEGFDGYVAKPFSLPDLALELTRVIKR